MLIVFLFFVLKFYFELLEIVGVCFVMVEVGIKYVGCIDVLLVIVSEGIMVVGVFIWFKCLFVLVDWCKFILF